MTDRHPVRCDKLIKLLTDLGALETELEIIQVQLARSPTRRELAQSALLATLAGAAIVLAGIEALFR
jgi:ferric-dicitrate binding protein FerR (iron transport regulator)